MLLQARIERDARKFADAIAAFEEQGRAFDAARAYLYYGEALLARDADAASFPAGTTAGECLQRATELFSRLGARGWCERVTAAPGLAHAVPDQ